MIAVSNRTGFEFVVRRDFFDDDVINDEVAEKSEEKIAEGHPDDIVCEV